MSIATVDRVMDLETLRAHQSDRCGVTGIVRAVLDCLSHPQHVARLVIARRGVRGWEIVCEKPLQMVGKELKWLDQDGVRESDRCVCHGQHDPLTLLAAVTRDMTRELCTPFYLNPHYRYADHVCSFEELRDCHQNGAIGDLATWLADTASEWVYGNVDPLTIGLQINAKARDLREKAVNNAIDEGSFPVTE